MKNESINKLHAEMDVLIVNISKEILTNPSIKEARDNILSGMDNSSKEATDTISTIVTSAQSTLESHIAKMTDTTVTILNDAKSKYDTMIQSITDHRDGAITDFAAFQSKLQGETKATLEKILSDNKIKIRNDLDTTIIEHDARLRATADDIRQKIKISLLLGL